MANRAAILTQAKAYPLKVDDFPMPVAGPHQMVVKVNAVAFNPADAVIQSMGVLVNQFPSVLGEDLAGEVVSTGQDVTSFKPGDRVVAMAAETTDFSKAFSGCFQLYCLADDVQAAIIPDNVRDIAACVLPLCLVTAAASILVEENLGLPFPQLNPKPTGTTVLIWGASTSVGSCAVQLARAGGCKVATTSSPHNLQYCHDLGATHAFDYKSHTIVDDIVEALKGKQSAGVFCCVQDVESVRTCARIASRLGGRKFVATIFPRMEGFSMPDNLPEDVEMGWNVSTQTKGTPCGTHLWQEWLTPALASGSMKCKPDPEVVGEGLESIQKGLDLMAKGVSAKKLVVKLA